MNSAPSCASTRRVCATKEAGTELWAAERWGWVGFELPIDDPARLDTLKQHVMELGLPFHAVSGVSGEGLPALLEAVWAVVEEARRAIPEAAAVEIEESPDLLSSARTHVDR